MATWPQPCRSLYKSCSNIPAWGCSYKMQIVKDVTQVCLELFATQRGVCHKFRSFVRCFERSSACRSASQPAKPGTACNHHAPGATSAGPLGCSGAFIRPHTLSMKANSTASSLRRSNRPLWLQGGDMGMGCGGGLGGRKRARDQQVGRVHGRSARAACAAVSSWLLPHASTAHTCPG